MLKTTCASKVRFPISSWEFHLWTKARNLEKPLLFIWSIRNALSKGWDFRNFGPWQAGISQGNISICENLDYWVSSFFLILSWDSEDCFFFVCFFCCCSITVVPNCSHYSSLGFSLSWSLVAVWHWGTTLPWLPNFWNGGHSYGKIVLWRLWLEKGLEDVSSWVRLLWHLTELLASLGSVWLP